MMITQERAFRQEIFQSIRSLIQELHEDKAILEDVNGAPFLFKSKDAQVWVRIFYRSMRDFSIEELQKEIKKLWVLMPNDASLYLFYPELDREQIFRMNGFSDRLSFFEYAGSSCRERQQAGIRICKWIPSLAHVLSSPRDSKITLPERAVSHSFMRYARLTPEEVSGLAELSLALKRV